MTVHESYLLLGLRLGRHVDGLVDAYFGPPELAEEANAGEPVPPEELAAEADALLAVVEDGWLADLLRGVRTYAGVLAGDVDSAARYVHFPLRVNHGAGRHESIASTQALKKAWPRLFTPPYLAAVRDASPHAMSVVQGYAMLGNGLVFFSERGVDVLNVP